ncbi:class II aldolase/adducin family protein [Aliamphritea ceti]|uniref:class II aldolase/adducin family protein n=1 Tax=Aliamphritea ceti TaxID=1524258 RepID=UPI0021C4B934|nr:class II aldolase/adducin family protein [Aliamphritea ceti]
MFDLPKISLKGKVSEQEWQLRVDLAACYRLVADLGWDDIIYTHLSARLDGTDQYLVNAFGLAFDEVTASNLVKVDLNGNILDDTPYEINPAGFTIHSAVHAVREDAHCVMHLHTPATIAVASQKEGLQPYSQYSMFSLSSLSYHGYEGLAVNDDEKKRLQDDLGTTNHMLLVNHGGLTLGPTVGDAFMRMFDLQRACEIQLMLQASGQEAIKVPQPILDNIYKQAKIVHTGTTGGQKIWPAMLRKAYKLDPGFMD